MNGIDAKTIALVGAAVAAPSLAMAGARAGVPIPAHVTAAQRAAVAELERAGFAASVTGNEANMCAHRVAVYTNTHPLDKQSTRALCDAILGACHAGVMVNDPTQYELTAGQAVSSIVSPMPSVTDLRAAVWGELADTDGRDLTDLGRAAAQVMQRRKGVLSGFLSSPQDLLSVKNAVDRLAIEMDDKGYLVGGKPVTLGDELAGGFDAAATATKKFIVDKTADAGMVAMRAVADLVLGSPVLFAAVGFVAWRVIR